MKRILVATLLLSSVCLAQTADDIINKAIAARGGMNKIKSVQALHMEGTISFGGDEQGNLIAEWKRPGKFRQELVMTGKTMLRITNGSEGWSLNPFAGDTALRALEGDEVNLIAEQADFDKPLVDYKAKGNTVELVGKEQLEGKDTYKLKLTLKNGAVRYENIDATSFLETKWNGKIANGDKEVEFNTFFRDYKTVEGLQFPSTIDTDTVGSEAKQKIVFDKIEVNPKLNDTRFEKPPAAATAAPK
jgi:outer membrane lipoprotein-sorting protein